jgi:Cu/Ag efflux pump CusA
LRRIVDISIRLRLLVVALAVAIMVTGILRLAQMPAEALPGTSPPAVDVQTEAAGLSAAEVEALVTLPLEKILRNGVPGVADITSDSVAGLSAIELRFAAGTDPDRARALVKQRLSGAAAPSGASGRPVITQPASSASDVMLVGLTSSTLSLAGESVLARWAIVPRLLALPGVANVSTFGQAGPQLQVQVDPARLAADHVTLAQIMRTAGDAQPVPPVASSAPGPIQPALPFATPAALAQLQVAGAAQGVRLGDVALVTSGGQATAGDGEEDGSQGVVLVVQSAPSAGVFGVTREVDQTLSAMEPRLPGVTVDASLFREDDYLRDALDNLRSTLVAAGVLAALALLALLLQLRLSFAALFAMALSLVAATAVLALRGYTFNALLTLGLLLALAIVVMEAVGEAQAIAARIGPNGAPGAPGEPGARGAPAPHARAPSRRTARMIAAACADMRGTLTGAGLAALLSVVPLLLATGPTAAFVRPMAVSFALAVIVSMMVAVTVTPALAVLLLTMLPPQTHGRPLPRVLGAGYARLIARLARAPRLMLAGAALSAALGGAALAVLPFMHPNEPSFDDGALVVALTGPPGVSLTSMDQMVARASGELSALPAVAAVGATIGRPAVTSDQVVSASTAQLWVTIKPGAGYRPAVAAVRSAAAAVPGLTGTVSTDETDAMAGVLTAPATQVVTRVYGADLAGLERLAGQLRTVIRRIGGVDGTQVQFPVEQPTVDLTVNPTAAARAGISPADVRREAGPLLYGLTVEADFHNQEVFDIEVSGTPAVRDSLPAVRALELDTPAGGHVRLGQVARVSVSEEPADIEQQGDSGYLDVTALVPSGQAEAVSAAIDSRLASFRFPRNYFAELVTGAAATGLTPKGTGAAGTSTAAFVGFVVGALAGVLLIAQAATGSWRLAALVFGSLPVALSGGALLVIGIGAFGQLGASAGLLGVFALAARQAIAVTARASRGIGLGLIVTPTVVTAVALVPFAAMGDEPGLETLHIAAAVLLAGLATTTLVGLFVLPVAARLLGPRLKLDSAMAVSAADAAHAPDGDHAHADEGTEARSNDDGRDGRPALPVLAAPDAQDAGEPRERGIPRRGLAPVSGRSGRAVA